MLTVGEVVKGSFWPESVEIKKCEDIGENLFIVEALGRNTNKYYETLLDAGQLSTLDRLNFKETSERGELNSRMLQHYLQYYVLKIDQQYSSARALGSQKIMPLPHQIEAVYSRMLQAPQVRFLLADDPGAGKTIMSGMLIRELKARKSAGRILILVPPLVLKQWQIELQEKFGEDFIIITLATLKELNGKNPFEMYQHCLASLHWAARDEIKGYLQQADFDLVIVDEAHKMAAYTHGKKKRKVKRTKLYQLGESMLHHVEHCLLLTATPHKGDVENFRHLMSLIDKDVFTNIDAGETLREKSNPFVIRRLKEQMVNFDGTPIFPKRTTKTIGFELSQPELDLYESVTNYVREHFNRAVNKGNNSTAFAMMLLQRRLGSSLEAIHLSLQRRREKLENLLEETKEEWQRLQEAHISLEDYDDEATLEEQQEIEDFLEGVTDAIDIDELYKELNELEHLIEKTSTIRAMGVERKYIELENTLFGPEGLLEKDEKLLIFTESTDTLSYLERRLLNHLPQVAVIKGKYSMEQRRQQVELFRDKCQVMLATDAGGESINLQFCNQMINYDIPWNPNRLEQRMGRIHRIGQENEVFVFNLVAQNTREGDVLGRLLMKMEQMCEDLWHERVYNFIGQVLDDRYADLATLMREAILNRQSLEDIVAGLDRTLSEEHKRLLEVAKAERLDESSFDLPGMRRDHHELAVKSLPTRVYTQFAIDAFSQTRIKIHQSGGDKVYRIERIPKSIRDFARGSGLLIPGDKSIRFTGLKSKETEDISLLHNDHTLFNLALALTERDLEQVAFQRYTLSYPVREPLMVEIHEMCIADGTGRELSRQLLHLARRENGEFCLLDPCWLFQVSIGGSVSISNVVEDNEFKIKAVKTAQQKLIEMKTKRDDQLNKKSQFLRRAFEAQYQNTLNRLAKYRAENVDQRKSALINQMNSNLEEIAERRVERLAEIERERSIQLRPTKRIVQLELVPNGSPMCRLLPVDWLEAVKNYEYSAGRAKVKAFDAFALVDFFSETYEGDARFIIITDQKNIRLEKSRLEDLADVMEKAYIYMVQDGEVVEEMPLKSINNDYAKNSW